MNLDIISHGEQYFRDAGIKCPECTGIDFSVQHITWTMDKPATGIYELSCRKCWSRIQIVI